MADTRFGTGFEVAIILNGHSFASGSVSDFSMRIGLDHVPYGTFSVLVNPDEFKPVSGCWGAFTFINTSIDGMDDKAMSFYCSQMTQKRINQTVVKCNVDWVLGTANSIGQSSYVFDGTSVDALYQSFKTCGYEVEDLVTPSSSASSLNDTMKWRFIYNNMGGCASEIVNYSAMQGDYLFWTFNEQKQKYTISSFGIAQSTDIKQALFMSQDADSDTERAMLRDTNTGTVMWLFRHYFHDSIQGNNIERMFPNVLLENVTNEGILEIGTSDSKAFDKLVAGMGGKDSDAIRQEYGLDTIVSYGAPDMRKSFPGNTHKYYSVAPQVRERLLGEYSKRMVISLKNTIGPVVGSAIVVGVYEMTAADGNLSLDRVYSDQYVIISKEIRKKGTLQAGTLGNTRGDMSPDFTTILTLVSSHLGDVNYDKSVESLQKLAKNVKPNTKSEG